MVVTNDNTQLYAGNEKGWMWCYSIKTHMKIKEFGKIFDSKITNMEITPDNMSLVVSADQIATLKVFSIDDQKLTNESTVTKDVRAMALTKDCQKVYTVEKGEDDIIRGGYDVLKVRDLYDESPKKKKTSGNLSVSQSKYRDTHQEYAGPTCPLGMYGVNSMLVTHDNKYLYIADNKGNMVLFYIPDNKVIRCFGVIHEPMVVSMASTKNNRLLYTAGLNGDLKVWNIKRQELVKDFGSVMNEKHGPDSGDNQISGIFLSNDDRWLTCVGSNGSLREINLSLFYDVRNFDNRALSFTYQPLIPDHITYFCYYYQ